MMTLQQLKNEARTRRELLTRIFIRSMTKAQLFAAVAKNPLAVATVWMAK